MDAVGQSRGHRDRHQDQGRHHHEEVEVVAATEEEGQAHREVALQEAAGAAEGAQATIATVVTPVGVEVEIAVEGDDEEGNNAADERA